MSRTLPTASLMASQLCGGVIDRVSNRRRFWPYVATATVEPRLCERVRSIDPPTRYIVRDPSSTCLLPTTAWPLEASLTTPRVRGAFDRSGSRTWGNIRCQLVGVLAGPNGSRPVAREGPRQIPIPFARTRGFDRDFRQSDPLVHRIRNALITFAMTVDSSSRRPTGDRRRHAGWLRRRDREVRERQNSNRR